jgi:uncharacterized iron-regulated protein
LWYNPRNERIYDTRIGSYLPSTHPERYIAKELEACLSRRVFVAAEVHSNPCHHLMEYKLLTSLVGSGRGSGNWSIGMECFYRQHQQALDNFIYSHGDMGELKRETNWYDFLAYSLNSHLLNHSLLLLTHSLIHSLTHSHSLSLTHSLTHSLTRSLTRSLTCTCM